MSSHASSPKRPVSLGVIFLTLYIDLAGFSLIFPLLPSLMADYLKEGQTAGLLSTLLELTQGVSLSLGLGQNFTPVLFGGLVASLFAVLQFIFAPIWGALSDRIGRRPVLLWTVAGTALGYLVWAFSASFWVFVLSRIICGAFGGNLSVATAAVADVTSREERSKAMGLVGAAFGLGLVTGPMLGAAAMHLTPHLGDGSVGPWHLHPYSLAALLSVLLSLLNLFWIKARFKESLSAENAQEAAKIRRIRNPLLAILGISNPGVKRVNLVAFVYSMAFVSLEITLTYLAAQRFNYTAVDNGLLLGFLGLCSILTQGVVVRRLLKKWSEIRVLKTGLLSSAVGFLGIGFAQSPWMLYLSIVFTALGSGLINPSTTGLISLYSSGSEQGRALGIFRSLGSLSRAITPMLAGTVFWLWGAGSLYVAGTCVSLLSLWLAKALPNPQD